MTIISSQKRNAGFEIFFESGDQDGNHSSDQATSQKIAKPFTCTLVRINSITGNWETFLGITILCATALPILSFIVTLVIHFSCRFKSYWISFRNAASLRCDVTMKFTGTTMISSVKIFF